MTIGNSHLGKEEIKNMMSKGKMRIHFTGVGGVGMLSLYLMSVQCGMDCSGSDIKNSYYIEKISRENPKIYVGNRPEMIIDRDFVVYSLAVDKNDGEIKEAEKRGIPIVSRGEYMSFLVSQFAVSVSVSGTHGKSTTTAMLYKILSDAQKFPTGILGANFPKTDLPYAKGNSDYVVFEACEYKDSFLLFSPSLSLYTNLEHDHADYFKDIDALKRSFCRSMNSAEKIIYNKDDKNLKDSAKMSDNKNAVTYAIEENADYKAYDISEKNGCFSYKILHGGKCEAEINLSNIGKFNIYNSLCAYAGARELGVDSAKIAESLMSFSGIERRLEYLGEYKGVKLYYDYAHHPTEIREGIRAIKLKCGTDVTVLFRPHTFSRTKAFLHDFSSALSLADKVYILDIDAVRENNDYNITSLSLAEEIGAKGESVSSLNLKTLLEGTEGALILMGAGNMDKYLKEAKELVNTKED